MKQEIFDFKKTEKLDWKDFIESSENHDALMYLMNWKKWASNGLIIFGDHGVGKTHLASLWAQSANAVNVLKESLNFDPRNLFESECNFVFDNFQDFLFNENWLFHFYNIAIENKRTFLILDNLSPNLWNIKLPDLKSRLNKLTTVQIKNHSDELLFRVTKKLSKDFEISVPDNVINYILQTSERNISSISKILKTLDKLSLQQKKSITLSFVKKYLLEK